MYAAVKALPPKYRAVVHLYYYEGYDQGEIGEILHISRHGGPDPDEPARPC